MTAATPKPRQRPGGGAARKIDRLGGEPASIPDGPDGQRHPATAIRLSEVPKIGGGIQYTVYDLGNGRVFKRPTTFWESYWRVLAWRLPFRKSAFWTAHRDVRRIKAYAARSLQNIRPLLPLYSRDLGNPVIYDDLSYDQDWALVVEEYFAYHTFAENKALIDSYIALLFRFWDFGFSEWPFKLCFNFGVDRSGSLILMDLGELFFDKDNALQRIAKRHWERALFRDPALASYYLSEMDRAMTPANVEARWGRDQFFSRP
jgi:hypothetical protein